MAHNPLTDEIGLLHKIAEGDERAFGQVYDFHYHKVYTFAFYILKSDVQAEEVAQETFLKLWKQGDQLKNIKNLEGFLITVSRNRALDILRRNKLEVRTSQLRNKEWVEMHNETEERILLNDTHKIIQKAIDQLPAQQRQVYQLCHQEGLKYEKVAEKLNLSVFTVQSYMKLALKNLRKQLGDHADLAALLIILKFF